MKEDIKRIMQPKNDVAQVFPKKVNDIIAIIEKYSANISQIAPVGFNVERFITRAANEIARDTNIQLCEPKSIIDAMLKVSMLGLQPSMGEVYFVARYSKDKGRHECSVMLGYQGLQRLMFENLNVQRFDADVVVEGEFFEFQKGTTQFIRHTKGLELATAKNVKYAWALVKINGSIFFDVVNIGYINNAKLSSNSKGGVWNQHFGEMATKTAIRHLLKRLPIYSEKLKNALSLENANFGDFQKLEDMQPVFEVDTVTEIKGDLQEISEEVSEICVLLSNGDMGMENVPEQYATHPEILKVIELIKQSEKEKDVKS